jgi:hypothetical protein
MGNGHGDLCVKTLMFFLITLEPLDGFPLAILNLLNKTASLVCQAKGIPARVLAAPTSSASSEVVTPRPQQSESAFRGSGTKARGRSNRVPRKYMS